MSPCADANPSGCSYELMRPRDGAKRRWNLCLRQCRHEWPPRAEPAPAPAPAALAKCAAVFSFQRIFDAAQHSTLRECGGARRPMHHHDQIFAAGCGRASPRRLADRLEGRLGVVHQQGEVPLLAYPVVVQIEMSAQSAHHPAPVHRCHLKHSPSLRCRFGPPSRGLRHARFVSSYPMHLGPGILVL